MGFLRGVRDTVRTLPSPQAGSVKSAGHADTVLELETAVEGFADERFTGCSRRENPRKVI